MDNFSTNALVRAVEQMPRPSRFLLDTFFTSEVFNEGKETISLEKLRVKPRIAPYVHPDIAAKPMTITGREISEITPPSVKLITPIKPSMVLKRAIGETFGGDQRSGADREAAIREQIIAEHLSALTYREQQQAGEILATGKVTVSGEGYDTAQVIDFGRAAGHTIALTGNDRWSVVHADSNPIADIEALAETMGDNDGGVLTDLIFGPTAWTLFKERLRERGELAPLFDYARSGDNSAQLGPVGGSPARFLGTLGGQFRCWWYLETYINAAGSRTPVIAKNVMTAVAAGGEGVGVDGMRAYGAILDPAAGYAALPYHVQEIIETNPGRKSILTQSAPLMIPGNPNSTAAITVS